MTRCEIHQENGRFVSRNTSSMRFYSVKAVERGLWRVCVVLSRLWRVPGRTRSGRNEARAHTQTSTTHMRFEHRNRKSGGAIRSVEYTMPSNVVFVPSKQQHAVRDAGTVKCGCTWLHGAESRCNAWRVYRNGAGNGHRSRGGDGKHCCWQFRCVGTCMSVRGVGARRMGQARGRHARRVGGRPSETVLFRTRRRKAP